MKKVVIELNVNAPPAVAMEAVAGFADGLKMDSAAPQSSVILTAEQAVGGLENRLAAALPSFDIGSILQIVDAVMSVLSLCKKDGTTAKDVRVNAQRRGPLAHMRVRQALRANGIAPFGAEGRAAIDAVFAVGAGAKEPEVAAVMKVV